MIKKENGTISLEACIVVPMFMFLILFVYGFIVMFMGQQLITHAMIQSAESLSLDSYALENVDFEEIDSGGELVQLLYSQIYTPNNDFSSNVKWYSDDSSDLSSVVEKRFLAYLTSGANNAQTKASEMLEFVGVKNGFDGLDLSETKIEDGYLIMTVSYEQEFIFNFNGLASFEREFTIKQKLWGI